MTIIQKFMIEFKNISSSKKNYQNHIKINDPKRFSNLGKIDYAIFDKTGTLTSPQFSVELIDNGQTCATKQSPIKSPELDNVEIANSVTLRGSPASLHVKKQYKPVSEMEFSQSGSIRENIINTSSTNAKKDFFFENADEEKPLELLKAASLMILCQKSKRNKPELQSLEEQAIFELCKNFQHDYEQLPGLNNYRVKNGNVVLLGVNDYSSRKRISALFYDKNEDSYTLFCRGSKNSILEVLTPMETKKREEILSRIAEFENQHLKMILYVKKNIGPKEAKIWQEKLQGIKCLLVKNEKALDEAAYEVENNFELIGIIGLKEVIKPAAINTFHFFQEVINSKVWILTGDNFTNAFNASKELYCDKNLSRECIHFKDKTANGLKQFIRNILEEIQNHTNEIQSSTNDLHSPLERFQKKNCQTTAVQKFQKKLLFVNGKILHIIMADPYLNLHFIFIVSLFRNVIGYNMTPELKEYMVYITKKINFEKPIVLAVGDSFNDARMMKAADVSIEVVNDGFGKGIGDIQINHLRVIEQLVLIKGHNSLKSLFLLLKIRYIQSFIFILSVVWLHSIYGLKFLYSIFTDNQKIFFFGLLALVDSLFFCLIDEIKIHKIIDKLNNTFEEELEKKALTKHFKKSYLHLTQKNAKNNFFQCKEVFYLLFLILCINYVCFLIEINFVSQEGYTNDIFTMSLFIFLNLVFFGQLGVLSKMIKKLKILKEKMIFVLFIIYVLTLILMCYLITMTSGHFYELYMCKNHMHIFGFIILLPIISKRIVNIFYEFFMKIILKFLKNKKTLWKSQISKEEK